MRRHPESESESLGISASSDDATGSPAAAPAGRSPDKRRPVPGGDEAAGSAAQKDLEEYGVSLGADPSDPELEWVVKEAFEAPLPTSWTEHVDAEGRLYFFNQVSEESTWSHPMDTVYRELIALIMEVRQMPSLDERTQAVRDHLMEVHGRALAGLEGWSGPYKSDAGEHYYYHERLEQSTWISPIHLWEYELAIRHSVLHRSLLAGFEWPEEPPDEQAGGAADLLTMPMLRLPTGLARLEEDEKSSARSFYTARESARSGNSTRSEQPGADRARQRAGATWRLR